MSKIHAVLLAAGKSSRFGGNKLLAPVFGKPMYHHMPDLIDGLPEEISGEKVIVSRYKEILEPMRKQGWSCVENEMPEAGISHSIFLGIQKVMEKKAVLEEDALLFAVCDQPFLKQETLSRLLEGFRESGKGIGCVCDQNRSGNPVVFSVKYAKELMSLTGDSGGKQVLLKHPEDVWFCPVEEEKELMDIDTPGVYREVCGGFLFYCARTGRRTGNLAELLFGEKEVPHILSIAGAGGKTTMAYELAQELKAAGRRVLVTTTTHMRLPGQGFYEWKEMTSGKREQELNEILESQDVFTAGRKAEAGKIKGIPPEDYKTLSDAVDILIVEADGSRGYPVKVPGDQEPVLYPGTDFFLGVLGFAGIGKSIREAAHHPEQVAAFLAKGEEELLTLADYAKIMGSPEGLLKGVDMPYALLLNRCPEEAFREADRFRADFPLIFCGERMMEDKLCYTGNRI